MLKARIFLKVGEGVVEEEQQRHDLATLAGAGEEEEGVAPKYSSAVRAAAGFCPAQKVGVEGEAGAQPHWIRYRIGPFLRVEEAGPFALSSVQVVAHATSWAKRQVALPV